MVPEPPALSMSGSAQCYHSFQQPFRFCTRSWFQEPWVKESTLNMCCSDDKIICLDASTSAGHWSETTKLRCFDLNRKQQTQCYNLGQRPKMLKACSSELWAQSTLQSQSAENIYKKLNQELFVFIFSNFIEQKCLRIVYCFYRPL